jgi:competence protein ComEA
MDAAPLPSAHAPSALRTAWPRSAQWTTALLLILAAGLLVGRAVSYLGWGSRPTDLEHGAVPAYRLDLNKADRTALLQLPGVGPNLASRVVDQRQSRGLFRSTDDLVAVRGVKSATANRLRGWVDTSGDGDTIQASPPSASEKRSSMPPAPKASEKKKAEPSAPVDINRATVEELQRVPGIGPVLAPRIIMERQKKAFQTLEDLCRVSGIKARALERLRPYLTVAKDADNPSGAN